MPKRKFPVDPEAADEAPDDHTLTGYDQQHLTTYLRLVDAEANGAAWGEVARYRPPHRSCPRAKTCATRLGEPLKACEVDDGARLSTSSPWRGPH